MHQDMIAAAVKQRDQAAIEHLKSCEQCLKALRTLFDKESLTWTPGDETEFLEVFLNPDVFQCAECERHLPVRYLVSLPRRTSAKYADFLGIPAEDRQPDGTWITQDQLCFVCWLIHGDKYGIDEDNQPVDQPPAGEGAAK